MFVGDDRPQPRNRRLDRKVMSALSMTKMGFDKLTYDIKGSTSRLKILLRNLES